MSLHLGVIGGGSTRIDEAGMRGLRAEEICRSVLDPVGTHVRHKVVPAQHYHDAFKMELGVKRLKLGYRKHGPEQDERAKTES